MFLKKKDSGALSFLIVGLGNPGDKYDMTRHNVGFMAADRLAQTTGADIKKLKFHALSGRVSLGGRQGLIVKPQTYMNNSGEAVKEIAAFYKIPPEMIVVIYDDISLPVGKLRIRRKGSDGGHNGIKSIIAHLGSNAFPRVKIGVGAKPHPDYDLADWVLSRFGGDEEVALAKAIDNACESAKMIVCGETDSAMNKYNS